jgi:hypothetical protein
MPHCHLVYHKSHMDCRQMQPCLRCEKSAIIHLNRCCLAAGGRKGLRTQGEGKLSKGKEKRNQNVDMKRGKRRCGNIREMRNRE